MNFKNSDVLVYRKVLLTLKLVPEEGTEKTIQVKEGQQLTGWDMNFKNSYVLSYRY